MRPAGEALGVGVGADDDQRQRRKAEGQGIQHPGGEEEQRRSRDGEAENELAGEQSGGQGADEVRGFSASMSASTRRLKAMAAERAATMATQIQPRVRRDGTPLAAMTAPVSPKGSVRKECSHLIMSRVTRML